jgi:hypothetical protein
VNLFAWEAGQLDEDLVQAYFQRLPGPLDVVMVQAPREASLERARRRGLPGRLQGTPIEVQERFMANSERILSLAAAALRTRRDRLYVVENTASPEHARRALQQALAPQQVGVEASAALAR